MLKQFITNKRKLPAKINVQRRHIEKMSTGSLEAISEPDKLKYIAGSKTSQFTNKIIKEQKTLSTSSLELIQKPQDINYDTGVKSSPIQTRLVNTKNILNAFHEEILQYSARYVKKHIDLWNAEENSITLINTLLDYGTEGTSPENFEVIVNGIHSPGIYNIKQDGNNVVVQFSERLFSYDGLQKENVIVIGKFLDIGLEIEAEELGIVDENGEPLIL